MQYWIRLYRYKCILHTTISSSIFLLHSFSSCSHTRISFFLSQSVRLFWPHNLNVKRAVKRDIAMWRSNIHEERARVCIHVCWQMFECVFESGFLFAFLYACVCVSVVHFWYLVELTRCCVKYSSS